MTDFPDVKLKALLSFPANVADGTGVDVIKENGSYRFDIAYDDFAPPVGGIISDLPNQTVLVWNAITGQYTLVPVTSVGSSDYITPEQYGARGDGSTDDTAAIQAAIDAAAALGAVAGGGVVQFGPKAYLFTSTINIDGRNVRLSGSGIWATLLNFIPTADDTAFYIANGANSVENTTFSDFFLYSPDTTYTKIAFDIKDARELQMHRLRVGGGDTAGGVAAWGGGTGSIALNFSGRDFIIIDKTCSFAADRPVVINKNPNSFIDSDHWDFSATLIADGFPCIEVVDGVYLSNLNVRGSWNLGTHGFYFHDTTSAITSHSVSFRDIRVEQGTDVTAWSFYWYSNGLENGLELHNFSADTVRKGFYLRGHNYVQMTRCAYGVTTNVALDADLITHLNIENCLWQTGSTASLGTLKLIYGGPIAPINGPLPATAYYSTWPVAEFNLGAITVAQSVRTTAPVTKTGDFTVATTENYLICNKGSSTTVTLPAAALFTGRQLWFKTIQAFTVVSASGNVVTNTSASAGTAILPATDGAWCMMVSDGANWVIMASSTLV